MEETMSSLDHRAVKRFHWLFVSQILLGVLSLLLFSDWASAQVPLGHSVARPSASVVVSPKPVFLVRSYDGTRRCLDYGTPPSPLVSSTQLKQFDEKVVGSIHLQNVKLKKTSAAVAPSVFLNDCAVAHAVGVQEIDAQHDVILHAGSQVIGVNSPSPMALAGSMSESAVTTEYPLELQPQTPTNLVGTPRAANQIFTLDGDSIILAKSRPCFSTDASLCGPPPPQLVVQVQNGSGVNGTPLIVGPRKLADSEFWDFKATDGSAADPTSGFAHVTTNYDLWNQICASPTASAAGPPRNPDGTVAPCAVFKAGRGSVVKVELGPGADEDTSIDLSTYPPLILPAGMTLRGNRRGTNFGPQLSATLSAPKNNDFSAAISENACPWCMIEVHGDYVRITGLRLKGQSRSMDTVAEPTEAIHVDFPLVAQNNYASSTEYIAMVDHNDISDWEEAAITVYGGQVPSDNCALIANDQGTQDNVRIERNFLHNNERWSGGYGSVMSKGGRAVIVGNTYSMNRHAIAADGEAHDQYRAWYNLVLSSVPVYSLTEGGAQQDFDMHGTGSIDPGYGGDGGNQVDIAGNTFLGGNRYNFELRGSPCVLKDYFRDNVTQDADDTFLGQNVINLHKVGAPVSVVKQGPYVPSTPVTNVPYQPRLDSVAVPSILETNNEYPSGSLDVAQGTFGVGDFDGDGVQDLFLATGAAWYYSPGGSAEWRFLSAKTDKIGSLLFGDFDGDGRTDVVTKNGNYLEVSWGGVSDWERLNTNAISAPISDMAVGNFVNDFIGDRRDDIFWADGTSWRISSGGAAPFSVINTSSFRVKDLRFGDFDRDGQTDVFGVVGGSWSFSKSAHGSWSSGFLQEALAPITGLVVADFNGDGIADVATSSGGPNWAISYGGRGNWVHYQIDNTARCVSPEPPLTQVPAIGHFDGNSGADVLLWDGGAEFCIASGGTAGLQPYSMQDMR
jgi:hypothetical protein